MAYLLSILTFGGLLVGLAAVLLVAEWVLVNCGTCTVDINAGDRVSFTGPLGPEEKWEGETGFIHLAVDKYLEAGVRRQAFLCGPPPMIDAVTRVLEAKGLRPEVIFHDKS